MRSSLRSPSQVEGTQGFLPQLKKDLEITPSMPLEARFPYLDSRAMPHPCSQLKWRMDCPGATGEAPFVPRRNSRVTPHVVPHFKKNDEIPPSSRDEALFIHAAKHEEYRGPPRNTKGDLTSLRRHVWVLQVDT